MAWSDLKAAVAAIIKTNGNQEITGALHQLVINNLIDNLGENASFKGMAVPSTAPGTPDGVEFYIAQTPGTYSNFAGAELEEGEAAIFSNKTGSWVKSTIGANYEIAGFTIDMLDDYSDYKYSLRKNKWIAYDRAAGKLRIIGSDAAYVADDIALTIRYRGTDYIIRGDVGDEQAVSLGTAHAQIGIPTGIADPSNISLSDLVVYTDSSTHDDYIKLAHVIYNDGITSAVIKDYRTFVTDLKTQLEGFITNKRVRPYSDTCLVYDPETLKITIKGNEDSAIGVVVKITADDGVVYTIIGSYGDEQEYAGIISGNTQFCIPKDVADPANVSLSDIVIFNDNTDRIATHVKIAHLTYNQVLTSNVIRLEADYYRRTELVELQHKTVFDGDVVRRTNRSIAYDNGLKRLIVVGDDTGGSIIGDQIIRFDYDGVTYTIEGAIGASVDVSGSISTGNTQFYIPKDVADPTAIQLSEIEVYGDTTDRSETHIKIAHLTFNSGITSKIITDYRNEINGVLTEKDVVYPTNLKWRKRKWLAWDRDDKYLKVVGSDAASLTDDQILNFTIDGTTYYLRGFVGDSIATGLTAGNAQIYLSKTVADPANVALSDLEFYNDATDRSATHYKLAHITYSERLTSHIIMDYGDYLNTHAVESQLTYPATFINNSIGENNFANGLRTELKILGFGNSFMRNSVHLLSTIAANGVGVNLTIGNLYTGGTNLSNHLAAMNNETNPYVWNKYENGVNTVTQTSQTAARGLLDERWDAIILHQYTPWSEPFQPLLNQVMTKIVEILGYCPKFYINSTWAGHEDYVEEQYGFTTELEMWEYMLNACSNACSDAGIIQASIIPTGTAIQNARTLAWADSYNRFTNAQGDWHHLNSAGGFMAACTIYEKIIYPLNGVHCNNTTFRINTEIALPPSTLVDSGILVTDSNYLELCQAAIDAAETPDTITDYSV